MHPFDQIGARRLMVFGHPGHELALFGVLQRYRPWVIVITDGGSPTRVEESRSGLASIDLLHQTVFLDYAESSFYRALLDGNVALFEETARRLRSIVMTIRPQQVFCDAIEFYNPVHDITLPIVRAALHPLPEVTVYEVPLVYQKIAHGETYEIQRVPDILAARRVFHELSEKELERKVDARDRIYASLHTQAGPEFLSLTPDHLRREEMALVHAALPTPDQTGRALRYEWRARLLREQGVIEHEITFAEHYLPAASHLVAAGAVPMQTGRSTSQQSHS